MYLLDPSICLALLQQAPPHLARRMMQHDPSMLRLCSVTKGVLLTEARRSAAVAENLSLLENFFSAIASLPFDDLCAEHYALIRQQLGDQLQLDALELMIASTARAHDLILVSHSDRYRQVLGLPVEDWTVARQGHSST